MRHKNTHRHSQKTRFCLIDGREKAKSAYVQNSNFRMAVARRAAASRVLPALVHPFWPDPGCPLTCYQLRWGKTKRNSTCGRERGKCAERKARRKWMVKFSGGGLLGVVTAIFHPSQQRGHPLPPSAGHWYRRGFLGDEWCTTCAVLGKQESLF